MKKIVNLLVLLLILGACVSGPAIDPDKDINFIVNAIRHQNSEFLVFKSSDSFLMDSEVLVRKDDVKHYWDELVKTESFNEYDIRDIKQVTSEDFSLYYDTSEVSMFFQKYLLEQNYLITLESSKGIFNILLGYDEAGQFMILGLRGPDNEM